MYVFQHRHYDSWTTDNDIALLKMERNVMFNDYIQPVCLPNYDVSDGTLCTASGWGDTQSEAISLL